MSLRVVGSVLAFLVAAGVVGLFAPQSRAQDADDAHCASFLSIKQQADKDRGARVDPMTVFLGVDVHCDRRLVEYGQSVLAENASLRHGWLKRLEKNWSAAYCKPGSQSADAIRAGWTISSQVHTSDGKAFRVTAICHEAVASL